MKKRNQNCFSGNQVKSTQNKGIEWRALIEVWQITLYHFTNYFVVRKRIMGDDYSFGVMQKERESGYNDQQYCKNQYEAKSILKIQMYHIKT
ncbi:MAG: hypothetical protein N4A41_07885 [Crocinitomicaceae bacterium]|nr:hypothetical protein [Crocinitomicaceae bacterium]